MDHDVFENARWLIGAIARVLHAAEHPAAEAVLARLVEQPMDATAFQSPVPQRLPVVSHLAQGVAESMLVSPDMAAAIAACEDDVRWLQSEAYSDAVMGEGFMANYGWCQIIGPNGFFPGNDFLLGLLMLGPGQHYRDHFHPAPELYMPLTGGTEWRKGAAPFRVEPAGTIIWHEPNDIHATRTGASPLLALWAWTKDVATPAKLVK